MGSDRFAGLRNEPEEHRDLAADFDLAVDISDVGLDGPGSDLQMFRDTPVSQPSANQIGNLKLAWSQVVASLQIGPLLVVEKHQNGVSSPVPRSLTRALFGLR